MALIGTLVRWYESYLIGPDIGHIPVSNLYEVFVMFCWMTAAFYLYYEQQYGTRALGGFVMLVVSAAVGFLLWYTVVREAHEIQPLVPALKSWWMKLHVPANFIGYGTFALAAMVAFAYLIKQQASETRWYKLAPLWLLGVVLCFEPIVFRQGAAETGGGYWMVYFGISALIVAGILMGRKRIAERLPSFEILDDVMYKSIAVGFAFFTIATVLGALWAAEAWGGYWSLVRFGALLSLAGTGWVLTSAALITLLAPQPVHTPMDFVRHVVLAPGGHLFELWLGVGALFAVERMVTAWHGGWRARILAVLIIPELVYDSFLNLAYLKGVVEISSGQRPTWKHVQHIPSSTSSEEPDLAAEHVLSLSLIHISEPTRPY